MKIFDCFMYFDEEVVLDVRLNTLDKYVDYFIIVESSYTHKGDRRKLKFNFDYSKQINNVLGNAGDEGNDTLFADNIFSCICIIFR